MFRLRRTIWCGWWRASWKRKICRQEIKTAKHSLNNISNWNWLFRRGTTTSDESGKCLQRLLTVGFSGLSSSSPQSPPFSSSSYFLTGFPFFDLVPYIFVSCLLQTISWSLWPWLWSVRLNKLNTICFKPLMLNLWKTSFSTCCLFQPPREILLSVNSLLWLRAAFPHHSVPGRNHIFNYAHWA